MAWWRFPSPRQQVPSETRFCNSVFSIAHSFAGSRQTGASPCSHVGPRGPLPATPVSVLRSSGTTSAFADTAAGGSGRWAGAGVTAAATSRTCQVTTASGTWCSVLPCLQHTQKVQIAEPRLHAGVLIPSCSMAWQQSRSVRMLPMRPSRQSRLAQPRRPLVCRVPPASPGQQMACCCRRSAPPHNFRPLQPSPHPPALLPAPRCQLSTGRPLAARPAPAETACAP